ncbi:MAG: hypothetical protein ACLFPD_02490 [Desulfosudaceae bacterium]
MFSFLAGLPLATSAGLYWLDIIDHFLMAYVITLVAILECIAVGWIFGARRFAQEVNRTAEIKIGLIFSILIKFLTPLVLGVIIVMSFIRELRHPYEGYPLTAIIFIGIGVIVLIAVGAGVLSTTKTANDKAYEIV